MHSYPVSSTYCRDKVLLLMDRVGPPASANTPAALFIVLKNDKLFPVPSVSLSAECSPLVFA